MDPVHFDCRDCDIGPDAECKFRADASLRHERSVRYGDLARAYQHGEEQLVQALDAVKVVLQRHHLSLPAAAIREFIPDDLSAVLMPSDLASLLRKQPDILESSPGMFRHRGVSTRPSTIPSVINMNIGTVIGRLLRDNRPLEPDIRRQKFKRLVALRRLCKLGDQQSVCKLTTTFVDGVVDQVLEREGWRLAEATSMAFDGSLLRPRWHAGSSEQSDRRGLLTGIFVLDLLDRTQAKSSSSFWQRRYVQLRNELLCANLRLVAQDARSYARGTFLKFADLFQSGFEGLNRAVELYDPYLGYEFSTYATNWIRQAITRSIANTDRTIRIPVHAIDALDKMQSWEEELYWQTGQDPRIEDIAERVGMEALEAAHLRSAAADCVPLSDEVITTLEEPQDAIKELISDVDRSRMLELILTSLSERECFVIERRFGLNGAQEQSLREIGLSMGITGEATRRIQKKALAKIESSHGAELWTSYLIED